ncbi:MAG: hypothetical protein L0177_10645 [Chloroflexi bacterium]|nr:hypothetical protein [Chloroflexota bacterium]
MKASVTAIKLVGAHFVETALTLVALLLLNLIIMAPAAAIIKRLLS